MIPLAIKPIVQTGIGDCAIAALAMYTGKSYGEAASVAVRFAPKAFARGMWCTEIQKAAAALGVHLKQTRRFSIDEDTGILCVDNPDGAHAVVLFHGLIVNSADGQIWEPEAYFIEARATPRVLLRP